MSPRSLDLLVINASVRDERFGPVVAGWFAGRARLNGRFETAELDLGEVELPTRLPSEVAALGTPDGRPPAMRALYERLERAEATWWSRPSTTTATRPPSST